MGIRYKCRSHQDLLGRVLLGTLTEHCSLLSLLVATEVWLSDPKLVQSGLAYRAGA